MKVKSLFHKIVQLVCIVLYSGEMHSTLPDGTDVKSSLITVLHCTQTVGGITSQVFDIQVTVHRGIFLQ